MVSNDKAVAIIFATVGALAGWLIVGLSEYHGAQEFGRKQGYEQAMSEEVILGDPEHPECQVSITRATLSELVQMGILSWPDACVTALTETGNE